MVTNSPAGLALSSINKLSPVDQMEDMRIKSTINCTFDRDLKINNNCQPLKSPCLFNILEDPCETNNLADR